MVDLIDDTAFAELSAGMGKDVMTEIVDLLCKELDSLEKELNTLTRKGAGDRAHQLKASTGYPGARVLRDLAVRADAAFKAGNDPKPLLVELLKHAPATMTELKRRVEALPPDE